MGIRHEYKGGTREVGELVAVHGELAKGVARWAESMSAERWDLVSFSVFGSLVHAVFRRTPE